MVSCATQDSRPVSRITSATADDDGPVVAVLAGEPEILELSHTKKRKFIRIVFAACGRRFTADVRGAVILEFAAFREACLDQFGLILTGEKFATPGAWLAALATAADQAGGRK